MNEPGVYSTPRRRLLQPSAYCAFTPSSCIERCVARATAGMTAAFTKGGPLCPSAGRRPKQPLRVQRKRDDHACHVTLP